MLESVLFKILIGLVCLGGGLRWVANQLVRLMRIVVRLAAIFGVWVKMAVPLSVGYCADKIFGGIRMVKHKMNCIFRNIGTCCLWVCGYKLRTGEIDLTTGHHEIKIDTCSEPFHVWFLLENNNGVPVCHGNVDKVGVEVGDKFFTLYADISSSHREVRWMAVLK